ncbi:MAG: pyrroline-5-carboxylate reductase [Xanthomonadaceae bacterium]|nr:pyrroline-5-carboxylate reductase [Xanthomonadaceae bacterium]
MKHKTGLIGVGKMGEALIQGIQKSPLKKDYELLGSTASPASAESVSKKLGIKCFTDNAEVAGLCKILILCVKPHQAEKVLKEISPELGSDHLLISICASITISQLREWSGGKAKIIRAMPNTPALIGQGMTVLSPDLKVSSAHLEIAEQLFQSVGLTAMVEESLMDGVTGLSGCGPAYIYLIIEALSEAGVKVGLSRKLSTLLAAQTMKGAAQMVLSRDGEHPAAMKDEVTTPAGCTIDGLMALEEGKLRVTLIKAVLAATRRSQKLRSVSGSGLK